MQSSEEIFSVCADIEIEKQRAIVKSKIFFMVRKIYHVKLIEKIAVAILHTIS